MRISEERTQILASGIANALLDDEHVDLEMDEGRFQVMIEGKLLEILRIEDQIDEEAAAWIIENRPYLIHGAGLPIREILERVIWLGHTDIACAINVIPHARLLLYADAQYLFVWVLLRVVAGRTLRP